MEAELLRSSEKYVYDKVTEKASRKQKQKEKREAIAEAQSSTTIETTKAVVDKQKKDGSFEISKELSNKLDISSEDTLVTSIQKYTNNEKLKNKK